MQSRIEEIGPCRRKLTVTVSADQIKNAIEKSYGELRRNITLPGFRRGKAPRSVLERRFGDHVMDDVKRDLIVEGIEETIREHKLEVVSDPDFGDRPVELEPGTDFEFTVEVDVKPDFEIPSFEGIKVTRSVEAVTEARIDEVMERLRQENASWIPVEDGGAQNGDLVIGGLRFMDGDNEAFKREQAHLRVGDDEKIAGAPISGGSACFVGKASGEQVEAEVTIPGDHPISALRGKTLAMHFDLQEVKRMELPEIDDDFAGGYGLDDLAALRGKIREDLEENARLEAQHGTEEKVLDALLQRVEIPVPDTTLNRTLDAQARDQLIRRVMSGQMGTEDMGAAMAALREELRGEAEHSIRAWYLMQKIAKREKIFATEDDVQRRIEEMAMSRGTTPTKVREELAEKDALDQVRTAVLEQKVRIWLTEQVEIVEDSVGSADAGAEG
ncbi:MAG: trigger factor [Planctomycetes bacterium]|nr:trigger factor [Planctomycetota bacterium]